MCSFYWSGHGKRIMCCNLNDNAPSCDGAIEAPVALLSPWRALAVRLGLAAVAGLVPWFLWMLIVGLAFKIVDDSYPYFLFFG